MGLYDQIHSPQSALEKLRIATARASAAQQIAQRDYHHAQAEADEWKRKYQLALNKPEFDVKKRLKTRQSKLCSNL